MDDIQTDVPAPMDQAAMVERGELASGSVIVKLTGPNSVATPGDDIEPDRPTVANAFQFQHAKIVRFEISVGKEDSDRTIEEFEADIRSALEMEWVQARNVTLMGEYYIIDGKVCLTQDYDADAKNRKPGTNPPSWAGGPDERSKPKEHMLARSEYEPDPQPVFAPVDPPKKVERNEFGRRIRSDKGVKRGPRKGASDKMTTDAFSKMADQMREVNG